MALLIIFLTCISCVLLNFDFIEANSPILSNSRILCVEYAGVNEMIQVAPNDTIFRINQTNFEISYTVIPEVCIHSFVITQIEIEVISNRSSCDKDYIDIREYIITSKFRSLKKSLQLNSNQNKVQNLGSDIVSVTIEPTLADKLYVSLISLLSVNPNFLHKQNILSLIVDNIIFYKTPEQKLINLTSTIEPRFYDRFLFLRIFLPSFPCMMFWMELMFNL